MDRKTTTFIILLGLIIVASLFQGCIEGNTTVLDTLEYQKKKQEKELERLNAEQGKAYAIANTPCDNDDCAIEKRVAKDYIKQINLAIDKAELKVREFEDSIKAITKLQKKVEKQQKEIEEQRVEIRKSQNSAQGSSHALGELSPNIIKQREIQNETKQKLAAAIKKIHALK